MGYMSKKNGRKRDGMGRVRKCIIEKKGKIRVARCLAKRRPTKANVTVIPVTQ